MRIVPGVALLLAAGAALAADPDGWAVGSVCYASQTQAAEAACASFGARPTYAGTTGYVWSCRSGAAIANNRAFLDLERATECTPSPCFPTVAGYVAYASLPRCVQAEMNPPSDAEQVNATLAIWAAGLGLLALLWGGRQVYEYLVHGRREA